ncbi:MAG: murein biosynthesis integral membrane protein MurJ [Epsilonproteobacteria bacterium]|nr:MAG: murein biosynthesis integral membrane protein MurJ [Campylobacterota bacterium]
MIKNIFTNTTGIFVSRIFGFARDLLMASVLGANIYTDIFFVAFKLPNLFRRIFGEGAFTQVFIPSFSSTKYKISFSTVIFWQFFSFIVFLSVLVAIFSGVATTIIAVGFDRTTINMASPIVAICFFYLPLIFVVTFLSAILQYRKHFATSAFSTALLNISLITALIISKDYDKFDIVYYLSFAVIFGGFLQVFAHLIAIKSLNIKVWTSNIKKAQKRYKNSKFYKQFLPAVFGSSAAHISAFLDTFLASFLSFGTISYLYYANRIFQLPFALFSVAVSIAIFPTIAKNISKQDESTAKQYMRKATYLVVAMLSIATTIGIVFDEQIIKLLFFRGEFSLNDVANTANILSAYLLGLLPYGLSKIYMLWLYSKERQKRAAIITAYSLVWNIVLSLLLIVPFGAVGLAVASSFGGFVLLYLSIKEFGFKKFYKLVFINKD